MDARINHHAFANLTERGLFEEISLAETQGHPRWVRYKGIFEHNGKTGAVYVDAVPREKRMGKIAGMLCEQRQRMIKET